MRISLTLIVRFAGLLVMASVGAEIGLALSGESPDSSERSAILFLMLAGAVLGLIIAPRLTLAPLQALLKATRRIELDDLLFMILGGFIGLIFGVLGTVPLSLLPTPFNQFLPLLWAILTGYIGVMVFYTHRRRLKEWQKFWQQWLLRRAPAADAPPEQLVGERHYLVDTSAIIDGRIAEVSKTGFLEGILVIPQFVLAELQTLADSSDELRRAKGRRGLELLNQMQQSPALPIDIIEIDLSPGVRVDDKLVAVARQSDWPIITNDFNLNRVAGLQGVQVLSLNELSEAVRPPVMQDQQLQILIRNEGNSRQQGVGYLDDGTPVVVEDARQLIGQVVDVVVVRLLQTQSGRLVFAQLDQNQSREPTTKRGEEVSSS